MALATWFDNVIDQNGNAVANASITVYSVVAGSVVTNPLPTIYAASSSDAATPTAISNPTTSDNNGNYSFAAPDGTYAVVISGASVPTLTKANVKLVSAAATGAGSGSVTSVALSAPAAVFTVGGSPVTTAGTLTLGLQTQIAHLFWCGPSAGIPATPTFRAIVNADLPTTGVGAAAYGSVAGSTINVPTITVNVQGVVTAATTTAITVAQVGTQNTWTKSQNVAAVALAFATPIATDATQGNVFNVAALTNNFTLSNPTGLVSGGCYVWNFTQDGVGNRVITYDTLFKFPSGVSSALSTAAGALDTLSCVYDGSVLRCTLQKGYS